MVIAVLSREQVIFIYFGDDNLDVARTLMILTSKCALCAFSGQVDPFVVGEADGRLEFSEGDIGRIFFVEDPADTASDAFANREVIAFGLVEIVASDDESGFGRLLGELHGRAEGKGGGKVGGDDLLAGGDADGAGRSVVAWWSPHRWSGHRERGWKY